MYLSTVSRRPKHPQALNFHTAQDFCLSLFAIIGSAPCFRAPSNAVPLSLIWYFVWYKLKYFYGCEPLKYNFDGKMSEKCDFFFV
jgi:hypothetical protein